MDLGDLDKVIDDIQSLWSAIGLDEQTRTSEKEKLDTKVTKVFMDCRSALSEQCQKLEEEIRDVTEKHIQFLKQFSWIVIISVFVRGNYGLGGRVLQAVTEMESGGLKCYLNGQICDKLRFPHFCVLRNIYLQLGVITVRCRNLALSDIILRK